MAGIKTGREALEVEMLEALAGLDGARKAKPEHRYVVS